jgi:hypothetical protein
MIDSNFRLLLENVKKVAENVPGAVFIGGVAVYLHASQKLERLAEASHDADMYIGLSDLTDLRDQEELTQNRRLNKQQFIKSGISFGVYVEKNNALAVPYDEILVESNSIDGINVASLGHLLILKLDAAIDRAGSNKGQKDIRDIIRILLLAGPSDVDLAKPFFNDEHRAFVASLARSPTYFSLADGNAMVAKQYRQTASLVIDQLIESDRSINTHRPKR